MANEAKFKHLDYIQGIVNRLGNNGFLIKGWTITIVAAILAIAADDKTSDNLELLLITIIPIIFFWILDGYFLWQERLFRELYKEVSKVKDDSEIDFQMNVGVYNKGRNTWLKSIFSKTLNIFYFSLIVVLAIVIALTLNIQ